MMVHQWSMVGGVAGRIPPVRILVVVVFNGRKGHVPTQRMK